MSAITSGVNGPNFSASVNVKPLEVGSYRIPGKHIMLKAENGEQTKSGEFDWVLQLEVTSSGKLELIGDLDGIPLKLRMQADGSYMGPYKMVRNALEAMLVISTPQDNGVRNVTWQALEHREGEKRVFAHQFKGTLQAD